MMGDDDKVPPIDVWLHDPYVGAAGQEARKEADRLACEAWNYRMLGYKGPAQPSPTLGECCLRPS